ncbi:MAG: peptidylprolyl isomerase [bacterium]
MIGLLGILLLFNIFNQTGVEMNNSAETTDEIKVVEIITSKGSIVVHLYCKKAPATVDNFLAYVDAGFYDGLIFHRVIEDFMVQGGGFFSGLEYKKPIFEPIVNEAGISQLSNLRGTIAMARTTDPNSATSQFYINTVDNCRLDWNQYPDGYGYCVFGKVVEGMEVVDEIEKTPTKTVGNFHDVPLEDIIIQKIICH